MSRLKRPHAVSDAEWHNQSEVRFRECYEANYRDVRRYVARLSGGPSDADDVTQDAFAQLWKQLEQGVEVSRPRGWLYRVATHLVINRFRSRTRSAAAQVPLDMAIGKLASAATDVERDAARRQLVRAALRRLPEPMRRCLLLHHAGLTGREIAEAVGVKPSYVGSLVIRGHERFRRECEAVGLGEAWPR